MTSTSGFAIMHVIARMRWLGQVTNKKEMCMLGMFMETCIQLTHMSSLASTSFESSFGGAAVNQRETNYKLTQTVFLNKCGSLVLTGCGPFMMQKNNCLGFTRRYHFLYCSEHVFDKPQLSVKSHIVIYSVPFVVKHVAYERRLVCKTSHAGRMALLRS